MASFPVSHDPTRRIINVHWPAGNGVTIEWSYTKTDNIIPLDGYGTEGPFQFHWEFETATPGLIGSYCDETTISPFGSPFAPPGVVINSGPSVSPTNFSFGAWDNYGTTLPQGVFNGLIKDLTLSKYDIHGSGVGYYGTTAEEAMGIGHLAGGWDAAGNPQPTGGTVSIDASGAAITVNGTPYVISGGQISYSPGGFTVFVFFQPP